MNNSSVTTKVRNEERHKFCWVCYGTEEDDTKDVPWVHPCKCKGSSRWVHEHCLQRWFDEKQKGQPSRKVSCPQCNTEYVVILPKVGKFVYVLELSDKIAQKLSPILAGGIFIGSVYWTAVTYGAVTVMQVLGHKEGLNVMESADPLFLLIGLPTIPLMLVLNTETRQYTEYTPPITEYPLSATRVLCGAMAFPTVATVVGKALFSNVNSNFQRTLLGGIAFVAIKGCMKIYYKQQQYLRQRQRKILNFDDGDNSEKKLENQTTPEQESTTHDSYG
ncbi:DgyrCDS353 [Dimorphilus gyrociliatus]|uniref:E3 ubiquitin-protein ligase MARCHF5 n=1 Tax=Dimorphilus gyrociliatus TaxID=2664684 RepID=A0A7I8V492_9ANNE|nr:DgyrCDS353 [Dimorphilus gyrociliatus]